MKIHHIKVKDFLGLQAFVTRVGSPGAAELEMRDGELFDPAS